MADDAALWGDPTTLCTLEELRSARAALQSYEDVLRTLLHDHGFERVSGGYRAFQVVFHHANSSEAMAAGATRE